MPRIKACNSAVPGKDERSEQLADLLPQRPLALHLFPRGRKQRAAALLHLIDQARQHHQQGQHHGQILFAVTVVVFQVVAWFFRVLKSLIKEINYRVKKTDKFWNEDGTESVLAVRTAVLSDDDWLAKHLAARPGSPFYRRTAA